MVPLDWVVMLAWNKECGNNLRLLRGKKSRREIADALLKAQVECSQEYIRKLENGEAASVSTKIITAIAKTLDVELIEIMTELRVEVTKNLCTPS
ncbi:helix-turn-helix domain-containing protein [Anabaena azotica]|uniref:Helix-turn-helix domain-containing protein n=1 Tax=Anabaena azotica FACHB-119 TaxID=947527 RepID=A0ABR8DC32_9NOST|nr:helix-turn-helix transcriptional regulator [Anabaena azotica]MBD2504669.1 helix-turn-helix domain-containing protein [Anabaena azotica FACHB-119]